MGFALFPKGVPKSKRLFDLAVTVPATILLLPVMALTALWIRITLGRPVIFRQARGGYQNKVFYLDKFRTMNDRRDDQGNLLPDEFRLTRLGNILRSLSLDELPGMFNVLKGEMSLVGPRPLFARYLERYSSEQRRRHNVLPGITGWAQVNGRNALSWEEKFKLDTWYVDHWSLGLDLKILFLTFWKVIRREGISTSGYATAPEFMGNQAAQPEENR